MDECIDKNMIDKDEYPQMAELESCCVHMIADLWNSPDAANTMGCSTTGSNEARCSAAWHSRQNGTGNADKRDGLRPSQTGFAGRCRFAGTNLPAILQICRYFDVELRQIPCEGRRLLMTPEEVIKRCDENTIGVVPTLGVTYTLRYEPVQAVSIAFDDLE